jgi:uncharacterized membrane protein AbrB (regulator of aidB expression)
VIVQRQPDGERFAATWFTVWQWLFGVAIAASLVTATLGFLPQVRVIGALTLLCALLGTIVCQLGLSRGRPAQRRAAAVAPPPRGLRAQLSAVHGAGLAQAGAYRAPLDRSP